VLYFVLVTHHEATTSGRCRQTLVPVNLGFSFVDQFYPSLRDKPEQSLELLIGENSCRRFCSQRPRLFGVTVPFKSITTVQLTTQAQKLVEVGKVKHLVLATETGS
jgi:hypothetical protein